MVGAPAGSGLSSWGVGLTGEVGESTRGFPGEGERRSRVAVWSPPVALWREKEVHW